ncbi:MAG: hypothetical protein ACJAVM_001717 [Sulfitobacter sp.]|jgi:hypothetical protein
MSRGDFWSRRKAAVQAEQLEDDREVAATEADIQEQAQADKSDAEILEELGLPDPDTLHEGDDFKVFLTETVPARIRKRALRRLWTSNPILANVDGLVDYGEDFNDPSFFLKNMQTAYQIGKGMTAHVEELARQAEAKKLAEAAPDSATPDPASDPEFDIVPEDAAPETETPAPLDMAEPAPPAPAAIYACEQETSDALLPNANRRMRFSFDETGQNA